MRNQIDPAFNPEDMPFLNVPAPPGSGITAGTNPASIKDPALRAQYEAEIEVNRRKANAYNLQQKLRTMTEVFWPHLKGYLIAAYAKPPSNPAELQGLMSRYHLDESRQAEISVALQEVTLRERL